MSVVRRQTAALFALLALAGCSKSRANETDPARKPIKARVVAVELRQAPRIVESVGTLFPFEEVTVSSEVEGRVDRVFADVGDPVRRGQPLVSVSPVELELALQQERAALEQVRSHLGLATGRDDLQDPSQAAEVKRAAADMKDAEQKYLRAKSLLSQGLIPQGTFDETEARYNSAKAAYDVAVQGVQTLRAQLAQRRSAVAVASKKRGDAVIRAPFAGQVKERAVTPGQYLKVQSPVMVIVNADPLRVRLKVPEKMAGWIAVGQPVSVSVEAYGGRTFSGTLSRISPSVDPQTRSFDVEALLENHDGLLKPGFFAKSQIASRQIVTMLVVPAEAVRYAYGVYKVFTVDGGVLKERDVKVGDRADESVEIVEGLKERERVALPLPGQDPRDGSPVEPVQ
jgi:membrane fusion protein (multidrug efflux system)